MARQASRIAIVMVLAAGTASAFALLGGDFEPISFVIALVLWGALFFVLDRGRGGAKM
jgi:hypothetical protein